MSINSAPRRVRDVLQDTSHRIMEEHMAVPAGKEPAQVPVARLTQPHDFQNMTQLVQQSLLHFVFMVPHTLQHGDNPLATLQKGTSRTRTSFQTEMRSILSKRCWKSTTWSFGSCWESFLQGDTVPALTTRQMGHKKTPLVQMGDKLVRH